MRNPTDQDVSLTAWFPLASALNTVSWELNPDEIVPRIASFQVSVDGSPVEFTVSELPNPQGAERPALPWASFPVAFPAGKDTRIQVRYLLPLQQGVKANELALYYIFQTGAGWAGSIGQAELIVNLPYPASAGTLAGIPPGRFSVPYGMVVSTGGLPPGTVVEGNQARWTWKDFEPGAQDDFAVWIMNPETWQALEAARAAVKAKPQDGQAWLALASIYRALATGGYNRPAIFSASYLESGLEAYRQAAVLLPEHPAPHAGLALLTLAPYMLEKNAPPEVMETVRQELELARSLEARRPELAEQAGLSTFIVEDVLNVYAYNAATATAEWSAYSTEWARQTAEWAAQQAPTASLTPPPSPTVTPAPSQTPPPAPSAAPETAVPPESGQSLGSGGVILTMLAGLAIGLVIVVALLLRLRGRGG
jgi:hypothetical protein